MLVCQIKVIYQVGRRFVSSVFVW